MRSAILLNGCMRSALANADEPLGPPTFQRLSSRNGEVVAYAAPGSDTRVVKARSGDALWRIPGVDASFPLRASNDSGGPLKCYVRSMTNFAKARALAEKWVELQSDGSAELLLSRTMAKPYGWVFFWDSSKAVQNPDDIEARLAGNAPFVVFRNALELEVLGTALPAERYLEILERQLPEATLAGQPEQPDAAYD